MRRSRTYVFGCKHFPEVESRERANWSCEFCDGAKLIEQASRSNEAVSSLDIDKLLYDNTTCRESVGGDKLRTYCSQFQLQQDGNMDLEDKGTRHSRELE